MKLCNKDFKIKTTKICVPELNNIVMSMCVSIDGVLD
jgi:hypothetical protein